MSEKITAMIEEIKALSVLELSELVHALEDTFGVSAAAVAAGPAERLSNLSRILDKFRLRHQFHASHLPKPKPLLYYLQHI